MSIIARSATIGDLLRIFAETEMIEYSEKQIERSVKKQMDPLGQILGTGNRDRLPCESLRIDPEDQEVFSILCLLERTKAAESL